MKLVNQCDVFRYTMYAKSFHFIKTETMSKIDFVNTNYRINK